jgi:hypothetical protein
MINSEAMVVELVKMMVWKGDQCFRLREVGHSLEQPVKRLTFTEVVY